jgi:hypothetical protein
LPTGWRNLTEDHVWINSPAVVFLRLRTLALERGVLVRLLALIVAIDPLQLQRDHAQCSRQVTRCVCQVSYGLTRYDRGL